MLEPYNEGTINVTSGSAIVSGNDTYWLGQVRTGDKLLIDHDYCYIVKAVTSDTVLEIDIGYLGITIQNKPYVIARDSSQWGMNAEITADVAALMKVYKLGLQAPVEECTIMKQDVTLLKNEAIAAKNGAESARADAQSAKTAAETAAGTATTKASESAASVTAANSAKARAQSAADAANEAKTAAETAKDVAVTAKTDAETAAISSANSAAAAATSASAAAASSAASESAKNNAITAQVAAENAKTTAVAAADAANEAKTAAETAKDVAVTAKNAAIAGAANAETAADITTTKASEAATSAASAANSAAAAAQSAADAAATVPEATETVAGKIAIATGSEVTDGAVGTKAVTPATLAKGKAGGVATLDPSGKVPLSQLPITQSTAVEPYTITAFDAAGEPSAITIGTATITITRDADRRLSVIIDSSESGYIYRAQYDSDGRFTGLTKEAI